MSDPESQRQAKRHSETLRRLRRRLEAEGFDRVSIERELDAKRAEQIAKRDADRLARGIRDIDGQPAAGRVPPLVGGGRQRGASPYRPVDRDRDDGPAAPADLPPFEPDDSKHRPASIDPLLTGAARATGATAKAVKRAKALTKFEHDRLADD